MSVTGDDAAREGLDDATPARPWEGGAPAVGLDPIRGADGAHPSRAGRRRPGRATVLRCLGSVAGGIVLVLSFPPYDVVWLAPPALALLTLSWHGTTARRGFWLGVLGGLTFLLLHLQWMRVVGDDAWVALAAAFSLFIGLVGAGVAATSRLRWWPVVVPALWVLSEAVRDRVPLGGFPWGRLAYGQTGTALTPYASLGGAPLVTFAVALLGSLLAYAVVQRGRPRRAAGALLAVVAVTAAGLLVPLSTAGQATDGRLSQVVAAVVQGDVPEPGMDFLGSPEQVLRNHVAETERLASDIRAGQVPAPDIVIWPENSSDLDPFRDAGAGALIQQAVDAVDVPVLVGAVVQAPDDPTHVWNTGIVWLPTSSGSPGPSDYYVKQHPVPFGEWIPGRAVLARLISRFDRIPRDFAAGDATGVLQLGPARIGDLICFEVAYDELGRAAVRGDGVRGPLAGQGARVLVVQTNNATYNLTGQPQQQLAIERLRAVEHGRAVLVASTSGITAVVSPDGTIVDSLGELTSGYLVETVPLRDDLTVADRLGPLPELLVAAGAVAAWVLAVRRARRRRDVGSGSSLLDEEPFA